VGLGREREETDFAGLAGSEHHVHPQRAVTKLETHTDCWPIKRDAGDTHKRTGLDIILVRDVGAGGTRKQNG
jgi:hypothetical protein